MVSREIQDLNYLCSEKGLMELRERNAIRLQAAKESMGRKWVLHPDNSPKKTKVKTVLKK